MDFKSTTSRCWSRQSCWCHWESLRRTLRSISQQWTSRNGHRTQNGCRVLRNSWRNIGFEKISGNYCLPRGVPEPCGLPPKFPLDILRANFLRQDGLFPPRMKKERQRPAKVIHFKWGSLPVDALNRQTMRELHAVARREGITIEQVMSKALDWCLTTRL